MLTHFIYIAKCMSRRIIWHISGWHWYFCDNVLNPRWPPWDMGKCHGLFILIANCIFSLQRMLYERCSGRKIRDRPVKSPLAARVPRVSCDLIQTWLYNFDWRVSWDYFWPFSLLFYQSSTPCGWYILLIFPFPYLPLSERHLWSNLELLSFINFCALHING